MRYNLNSILKFNSKHRIRKRLNDCSVLFNSGLLCHILSICFYLLYFFERGQNLGSPVSHSNGMLKMGCRLSVSGLHCPSVRQHVNRTVTQCNHRLDGQTHTRLEHDATSPLSVIWHLRVLMHIPAYAMAGQLAHYSVIVFSAKLLHSGTDIAKILSCTRTINCTLQGCLGYSKQLSDFKSNLAHAERVARVPIKAIELGATVDRDDITVLEDCLLIWNSMDNDIIDGSADACRKRLSKRIGVPLENRDSTIVADKLIRQPIQLEGRYTWLDVPCQFTKRPANKPAGLAHQLNLILCLQKDPHRQATLNQ